MRVPHPLSLGVSSRQPHNRNYYRLRKKKISFILGFHSTTQLIIVLKKNLQLLSSPSHISLILSDSVLPAEFLPIRSVRINLMRIYRKESKYVIKAKPSSSSFPTLNFDGGRKLNVRKINHPIYSIRTRLILCIFFKLN